MSVLVHKERESAKEVHDASHYMQHMLPRRGGLRGRRVGVIGVIRTCMRRTITLRLLRSRVTLIQFLYLTILYFYFKVPNTDCIVAQCF